MDVDFLDLAVDGLKLSFIIVKQAVLGPGVPEDGAAVYTAAVNVAEGVGGAESAVLRDTRPEDVLEQSQGYEFSDLQKMKRLKGINFNMLNVKSIRIMNRFAQKVAQFRESYTKKMQDHHK